MEIYYSSTYDLENCKCKPNYQDVYVVAKCQQLLPYGKIGDASFVSTRQCSWIATVR